MCRQQDQLGGGLVRQAMKRLGFPRLPESRQREAKGPAIQAETRFAVEHCISSVCTSKAIPRGLFDRLRAKERFCNELKSQPSQSSLRPMRLFRPLVLCTLMVLCFSRLGVASEPGTSQAQFLGRMPESLLAFCGGAVPDDKGLVGANRSGFTWSANQRGATLRLAVAAARGDERLADACWRAVDVTFQHQAAEGNFGDPAESCAFWLCELGRTLLVIQESPLSEHCKERISELKPKLARAAQWLVTQREDASTPNRLFFDAEAFGFSGILLGDQSLQALGRELLDLGLKLYRDSDGVFLEHGGHDSSYQAVCLLRLQEILLHMPDERLAPAIQKGVQWELSRIGADGSVSFEGNTRVHPGGETHLGRQKVVDLLTINLALLYYHERTGDPEALAAVERVCQRIVSSRKQAAGKR